MKFHVILFLCFAAVLGEKKINLEDIERDNLRSEAQAEQEDVRSEDLKYTSSNAGSGANSQYTADSRIVSSQPLHQIKYEQRPQPETYNRESYTNQQSQRPQQFYPKTYQTEEYQTQTSAPQVAYQPQLTQELSYQTEIPIGNHIQSYQQRIATQKFSEGIGKGNDYSSAAGKQFVFFTNSGGEQRSKGQVQPLLHQLASQASRNARLPPYTFRSSVNRGPEVSYQPQPQIQYVFEPQFVLPEASSYSPKVAQDFAYPTQQTYLPPRDYAGVTYNPRNPLYTQENPAFTQAYYIQPQFTQIYQEPAYFPASTPAPSYSQPESYYLPSKLSQPLPTQIPKRPIIPHGIPQNFAKIPQEPHFALRLPQLPAQNFKGGITQLRPISSGFSQHHYNSGSQTLLDSYTPSLVIAARDAERYRERPLHLESGFLPSKGSFAHSYNKKRKSE